MIDWKKVAGERLAKIKRLESLIDLKQIQVEDFIRSRLMCECKSREWGRPEIVAEIAADAAKCMTRKSQ